MKKTELNRFLPYEADYSLLSKCRIWETRGLWLIGILSVVLPVVGSFLASALANTIHNILNLLYFLVIIAYYVLDVYTETFLYPATARKRRKGFIDNSLGSKFLEKKVEGYYTNDNLNYSPYKMLINCSENCFFTLNIAKGMVPRIVTKNVIFSIGFLVIAYRGIKDNLVAIPILQILLSTLFITELIHHLNFIAKLEQLFERFKDTFTKRMDVNQTFQEAVLLFLDYETTLAYNKAPLSDSVYEKLNEKLSKEWKEIKTRYEIP